MEQNYMVLQGKSFEVEIQGKNAGTNYGWVILNMPREIIQLATYEYTQPGYSGCGCPQISRFYLGAYSAEKCNVDIEFALICYSDYSMVAARFTAHVQIVPSNCTSFSPCSENTGIANGDCCTENTAPYKYGYPMVKYGYPIQSVNECVSSPDTSYINYKYGYPCMQGAEELKAAMPYGFPYYQNQGGNSPFFGSQDSPFFSSQGSPFFGSQGSPFFGSQGSPFFSENTQLKYGYPNCR